jgi:hypothetical protein
LNPLIEPSLLLSATRSHLLQLCHSERSEEPMQFAGRREVAWVLRFAKDDK